MTKPNKDSFQGPGPPGSSQAEVENLTDSQLKHFVAGEEVWNDVEVGKVVEPTSERQKRKASEYLTSGNQQKRTQNSGSGDAARGKFPNQEIESTVKNKPLPEQPNPKLSKPNSLDSNNARGRQVRVIADKRPTISELDTQDRNDKCVILIRPADESSRKMLTSPAKLCLALAAPPYSTCSIKDVRVNLRKSLIAIDMENPNDVEDLLPTTSLGPWNVNCSRPNQARYLYGVISPVEIDADIETLQACLKVEGHAEVIRIERLQRQQDRTRVPSTSLRLVFSGEALPLHIKFGPIRYRVRPYEFPPLQCFRCQRPGHSARDAVAQYVVWSVLDRIM